MNYDPFAVDVNGPGIGPTTGRRVVNGMVRGGNCPQYGVLAMDDKRLDATSTSWTEGDASSGFTNFLPCATAGTPNGAIYAGATIDPGSSMHVVVQQATTDDTPFKDAVVCGRTNAIVQAATVNIAVGDWLCVDISANGGYRLIKAIALRKIVAKALAAATTDGAVIEVLFFGRGVGGHTNAAS